MVLRGHGVVMVFFRGLLGWGWNEREGDRERERVGDNEGKRREGGREQGMRLPYME